MSAIRLVNAVLSSTAPSAEFRVLQGENQIARLSVHAGGSASVPLVVDDASEVSAAQMWTVYAIVNGITTESVTVTNPNAVVTLRPGNMDGFSLEVA
jgi:hypothetical protein